MATTGTPGIQCAHCGWLNEPGARMCGGCGQPLTASATNAPMKGGVPSDEAITDPELQICSSGSVIASSDGTPPFIGAFVALAVSGWPQPPHIRAPGSFSQPQCAHWIPGVPVVAIVAASAVHPAGRYRSSRSSPR